MSRIKRYGLAISGALVAGVVVAALAYGSIPDGNGVAHGCYNNYLGSLRVIDSASSSCNGDETGLNWQTSSFSKAQVEASTAVSLPANSAADAVALCPSGSYATGGGVTYSAGVTPGHLMLFSSQPTDGSGTPDLSSGATPEGWRVDSANTSGTNINMTAYAICVS